MPVYFLIAILPAIASCASGSVALYAWQRREVTGARAFALCTGGIFIWCSFSTFAYLSLNETARIIFNRATYLGICFFPTFWLIFALQHAHHDRWISRRMQLLINVIPTMTLMMVLSDPWHRLIWKSATLRLQPFPQLVINHGPWIHYVAIPYAYLMLLTGFGIMLSAAFDGSQLYQRQTLMLLGAALIPFVCNVLYMVSGIRLYGLNLTPVGFAIAGLLVHRGLFHTQFLNAVPISYRTVFLNTTEAVILLDMHERIVDLNPSAIAEGGHRLEAESVIGKPFESVFSDYRTLLSKADKNPEFTRTIPVPTRLNEPYPDQPLERFREVKVRSLRSPGGRRVGRVIIIRDVTSKKQRQVQLEAFAYVDSLTGLSNRRRLEVTAEKIFDMPPGQMSLADVPIALLYIDLNHFKSINDGYGHDVGDAVLQYFAKCLENIVRQGDMVVRLGGDEFAALLYNADRAVAMEVRSRLKKALNKTAIIAGHCFNLSASIGVAYYPIHGKTLQDLLRRADRSMYREKRSIRKA
ncbi:MAG: histidine kinase N-terminal 7TM domain-containing protein [Phormidesmis sp.]